MQFSCKRRPITKSAENRLQSFTLCVFAMSMARVIHTSLLMMAEKSLSEGNKSFLPEQPYKKPPPKRAVFFKSLFSRFTRGRARSVCVILSLFLFSFVFLFASFSFIFFFFFSFLLQHMCANDFGFNHLHTSEIICKQMISD